MAVFKSKINKQSESYRSNYALMQEKIKELEGKVKTLKIDVSGSGEVDAEDLKAEDVKIKLKGSGDISTTASGSFDIRASGSGDIDLYGSGSIKRQEVTGSVKIHDHRKK